MFYIKTVTDKTKDAEAEDEDGACCFARRMSNTPISMTLSARADAEDARPRPAFASTSGTGFSKVRVPSAPAACPRPCWKLFSGTLCGAAGSMHTKWCQLLTPRLFDVHMHEIVRTRITDSGWTIAESLDGRLTNAQAQTVRCRAEAPARMQDRHRSVWRTRP